MKKLANSQNGFTLVEVLVSITLLLMVIVGPMQILTRANHSTAFATEQMTAWFLAQEGLELAQQGRDNYLLDSFDKENKGLSSVPWTDFKTGVKYAACFTTNGCDITLQDDNTPLVTPCGSNGAACQLYLMSGQHRALYQHDSTGSIRPFKRVITMQLTGTASQAVLVTSTVKWRTGSLIAEQKVVTSTYLFNIYDKL